MALENLLLLLLLLLLTKLGIPYIVLQLLLYTCTGCYNQSSILSMLAVSSISLITGNHTNVFYPFFHTYMTRESVHLVYCGVS